MLAALLVGAATRTEARVISAGHVRRSLTIPPREGVTSVASEAEAVTSVVMAAADTARFSIAGHRSASWEEGSGETFLT
jgi:hypothetical protein